MAFIDTICCKTKKIWGLRKLIASFGKGKQSIGPIINSVRVIESYHPHRLSMTTVYKAKINTMSKGNPISISPQNILP